MSVLSWTLGVCLEENADAGYTALEASAQIPSTNRRKTDSRGVSEPGHRIRLIERNIARKKLAMSTYF